MTEQVEETSAENQEPVVDQSQEVDTDMKEGDQASRADKRVQQDMLRYKKEFKAAEERNLQLQNQIKAMEERSLAEKSNYKELYERKNEELNTLRAERENDQRLFFDSVKISAVEKEAIKMGIRPEALEDIKRLGQDGVMIETTSTGNLNVLGVEEFVTDLKRNRPFWFKDQGAPTINNGSPGYREEKPLSGLEMLKLQRENPQKYKELMMKKFNK